MNVSKVGLEKLAELPEEVIDGLAFLSFKLRWGYFLHIDPDKLRSNIINQNIPTDVKRETAKNAAKQYFNMAYWIEDLPCGSACCIGGWLEVILRRNVDEYEQTILDDLFYPKIPNGARFATPEQAADVIDNMLLTGRVDWSKQRRGK